MADERDKRGADDLAIELSTAELRAVAGFAAACARPALAIFESARPGDTRPRSAVDAAQAFADGGERTKAIRDAAWAAQRAGHEARDAGGSNGSDGAAAWEAARAALAAASAPYLHPLARSTQVKHILGAAAHAARALELTAGGPAAERHLAHARALADAVVIDVLRRYPPAPSGGGPAGELLRRLDTALR